MLIEVCNLNIQYEEVEALFDTITENAKQDVDASIAHKTLIMSCIARHELGRAITLAERYLERLDVTMDSERESDLSITELRDLPPMENREKLAAMEILMEITAAVIMFAPERVPSVVYTMVNLISRYGNNNKSSFAYATYAFILCLMQRYQEGNHFGQLAVDLLEEYPPPGRVARIMNTLYANVQHWRQPVRDLITPLKTCHQMAMQAGDFEYGLYSLVNYTFLSWGSGKHLEHCLAEVEPSISLCQSKNQQFSLQVFLMFAEFALNLTGRSPASTRLEGKWFSEQTMLSRLSGNHFLLALYSLLKMNLYYLFGEPGAAYDHIDEVLKHRGSVNPNYQYTKVSFYGALACIAGLSEPEDEADRKERLEKLKPFEEELKLWAEVGPTNYQLQYDLVMAEKCRVSDKHWEAIRLYEKAIRGARENQFVHDQALANELYGQFWLEEDNDRIAEMYMREAHDLYHQWGADAKVTHLEDSYPRWFKTETAPKEQPDTTSKIFTSITQPITSIQLDLESITSASQLLAAETDLDQLCTKMITLVMANSGADKAVLLLKQENKWFVQARKDVTTDDSTVLFHQPFDPTDRETELIPESVFNYCRRTKDVLLLGDVQQDHRFAQDRMVQKHNIQSMACLPALSHGELKAMLYLENHQTAEVFTLENVGLLKHLSAQFAISVENAWLYANLNRLVEQRTAQLEQEIEERKTTERELQSQLILFDSLLDTAADTIEIFDPHTFEYIKWNQACTEITGYSDEEFATMNPATNFFDDADAKRIEAGIEQAIQEGSVIVTADLIAKDGAKTPMEFLGSVARDAEGNPLYFIAIGRDISERNKAEKALKASEEKYRDLVEKVSDVIYSADMEGQITYLNPAVEDLVGLTPEQLVGQPFAKFILPEDLDRLQKNVQELFSGSVPGSAEYRIIRPSGEMRWIHVTSQPFKDGDQITGVQGVLTDITERKKVEAQQEKVTIEAERQRLARELHDSVTQTLYSIDLFSRATQSALEAEKDRNR